MLDKFTDQEFTCEYKYDGERAQIHVTEDGTVSVSQGGEGREGTVGLLWGGGLGRWAHFRGGKERKEGGGQAGKRAEAAPFPFRSPPLPLCPWPRPPLPRLQIYSRNSENNSAKYPDVAALIPKLLKPGVKSIVLDAEAVAYDRKEGKVLPFQVGGTELGGWMGKQADRAGSEPATPLLSSRLTSPPGKESCKGTLQGYVFITLNRTLPARP